MRAARICSAGHGGQILLSETTRALLGNDLPERVTVRDLGEQHLKDVQHEHVYELSLDESHARLPAAEGDRREPRGVDREALRGADQPLRRGAARRGARAAGAAGPARHAIGGIVTLVVLVAAIVAIVLMIKLAF